MRFSRYDIENIRNAGIVVAVVAAFLVAVVGLDSFFKGIAVPAVKGELCLEEVTIRDNAVHYYQQHGGPAALETLEIGRHYRVDWREGNYALLTLLIPGGREGVPMMVASDYLPAEMRVGAYCNGSVCTPTSG